MSGSESTTGEDPLTPVEEYLAHLEKERRLSGHTVASYRRDIALLLRMAGTMPLDQLQIHHVRRFVARLHGQGQGGRSLARALSAWRGFFGFLIRDRGFTQNPCIGVRAPRTA